MILQSFICSRCFNKMFSSKDTLKKIQDEKPVSWTTANRLSTSAISLRQCASDVLCKCILNVVGSKCLQFDNWIYFLTTKLHYALGMHSRGVRCSRCQMHHLFFMADDGSHISSSFWRYWRTAYTLHLCMLCQKIIRE